MEEIELKKPFYKKWWFILIVAIIVIGAIGNAVEGDEKKSSEDKSKQEVSAQPKEKSEEPAKEDVKKEEAPKTPVERATAFINKEFKDKTNTDKARIVSIGESNDAFEIVLNGDDNFTTNMMRTGMLSKSADVFEEVSKYEDVTTKDLSIGWMMTLVDQYGNENEQRVLNIRLSKETLAKINWDNFNYDNFENIAETYFIHPALTDK